MKNYSITFTGLITILGGTYLVNTLGISESCSSEITSKAAEWLPILAGSIMVYIGRLRLGGVSALGVRKA